MSAVVISRAQRRQLQKLATRVDQVTRADARFFERFPHRRHRVRFASRAEIEQNEVLTQEPQITPAGYQFYVAVKSVAPGRRVRIVILGPTNAETDLSEEQACFLYGKFASDETRAIEHSLRQLPGGCS